MMRVCGGDDVICPPSASFSTAPIAVHPGSYTADYLFEDCPPGQWRNWTGLSYDPTLQAGPNQPRTGPGTGTSSSGSYDPTIAITPDCQLCPEGTYKPTR
jgi:hypothetical protein